MYNNDRGKEKFQMKYEQELIQELEKMVYKVDLKIKKSINRLQEGGPELMGGPEMNTI
jgi:hypothetical protein